MVIVELAALGLILVSLLVQGLKNKEIASAMGISEGTVKTHMKSILPKLDASDRTHAVMIALKRGILDV